MSEYFLQTGKMSKEDKENYDMSVIEREVQMGILKAKQPKSCSLAFLRKIQNFNMTDNKSAGNLTNSMLKLMLLEQTGQGLTFVMEYKHSLLKFGNFYNMCYCVVCVCAWRDYVQSVIPFWGRYRN